MEPGGGVGVRLMREAIRVHIKLIHVLYSRNKHIIKQLYSLKTMELDLDIAFKMGLLQYIRICYITC